MNNILILETQRKLKNLGLPTPLAISKEIISFSNGDEIKIKKILERIAKNEPWEYIRGYTYFKKHKIFVNKNVLIPRIETEELVDLVAKNIKKGYQIFDIGTGSGCIAISLSKLFPKNEIFACDISKKALDVAGKNVKENDCKNVKIINANLLDFEFDNEKPTVIVANLPYLRTQDIKKLDSSVKEYEPILALDGGKKGTFFYEKLIKQIQKKHINLKYIILEIDPSILKNFEIKNFDILKDSFGRKRFLTISPSHLK